jgi:transposase
MIVMSPPVTAKELAAMPPEFRVLLQAVIDHYEKQIAALEAEVAALKKTPRNSSLPPSTEHPHAKPAPQKEKSGKKQGGQPGHPKHVRSLIPTEQCQKIVTLKPTACRGCDF